MFFPSFLLALLNALTLGGYGRLVDSVSHRCYREDDVLTYGLAPDPPYDIAT